jgi:S-adenosylmethionine hydrolase
VLLAYISSSDTLEIAVREGNAAARLGLGVGDTVRLRGGGLPTVREKT